MNDTMKKYMHVVALSAAEPLFRRAVGAGDEMDCEADHEAGLR